MNIILTGASRGIGYETAKALLNYNISELFLISRNTKNLNQLKAECLVLSNTVKINIIDEDIVELSKNKKLLNSMFNDVKADIIINNAGYLVAKPFTELTHSDISNMNEVNFLSPTRLVQNLLKLSKLNSPAHIVNISSMGGYQNSSKYPGLSYYSASKAAIATMTQCLAEELKTQLVSCNCLALGAVQTEMLEEAFPGFKAPINANETGKYIADFAVNGHKYYNGQILPLTLGNP